MTIINACAEREDLGGGRFRNTHFLKPVAFDKPGIGWRRIVSDWGQGDANYPHIITEARMRVRTAANGDRRAGWRIAVRPNGHAANDSVGLSRLIWSGGWASPGRRCRVKSMP